jgi:hypothetical protein
MTMGGDLNALNTFPITWWIGHPDAESAPEKHRDGHYPYARRVRNGWQRKGDGGWVSSSEDPKLWEVFCEQCGDTDGPPAAQPEPAQTLRGPYPSKHKAEHVATKHFEEMRPA